LQRSEARKNRSKEEKEQERVEKENLREKYGFAIVDGVKEKMANYILEPPGLFRGRGDHPRMGCIKVSIPSKGLTCTRLLDSRSQSFRVQYFWGFFLALFF
jgi:DNA topoisomerase-1